MHVEPKRLTRLDAVGLAAKFIGFLELWCERIEVAGSVRRGLPEVGDLDFVCVPKTEVRRDLLGQVLETRNLALEELRRSLTKNTEWLKQGPDFASFIYWPSGRSPVQYDVWFTEPEHFGSVWLCRTGSKEHNILLAQRANARPGALGWEPHTGVRGGAPGHAATEEGVYAALGLRWIPPSQRDLPLRLEAWELNL